MKKGRSAAENICKEFISTQGVLRDKLEKANCPFDVVENSLCVKYVEENQVPYGSLMLDSITPNSSKPGLTASPWY